MERFKSRRRLLALDSGEASIARVGDSAYSVTEAIKAIVTLSLDLDDLDAVKRDGSRSCDHILTISQATVEYSRNENEIVPRAVPLSRTTTVGAGCNAGRAFQSRVGNKCARENGYSSPNAVDRADRLPLEAPPPRFIYQLLTVNGNLV